MTQRKRRGRALARSLTDRIVTMPALRWLWQGQTETEFSASLPEFRPADHQAVREMMAGRYLLAAKLVETGGLSPFSVDVDHPDWWQSLQSFAWLRHFEDTADPGERQFARTLVLDWIGREGRFARETWTLTLTAQRILNWLRHLPLLLDGATADQSRTLRRSLATQVQSLKVRISLAADPVERLFAAIGLLAAALARTTSPEDLDKAVSRLDTILADQLDEDGLHLTRNPRLQLSLLTELASLRRAAGRQTSPVMAELTNRIDRMHEALDALTLTTGELAYVNGCGQVPHDVLVAVQAHGPSFSRRSHLMGGYGILRSGKGMLIGDGGVRPPKGFDKDAHAGALSFEFAFGSDLIVGNCGPAPGDLPESRDIFRQGVAHSAPTIDGEDAIPSTRNPARRQVPTVDLDTAEHALVMTSAGYGGRFGAEIERRLTLLADGATLVGQDRILAQDKAHGRLSLRFHLAPGISVRGGVGEGMVRLALSSGQVWSFLWEGATIREEESVRQSASMGFYRTRQLVLETAVAPGAEVAWIFTREHH